MSPYPAAAEPSFPPARRRACRARARLRRRAPRGRPRSRERRREGDERDACGVVRVAVVVRVDGAVETCDQLVAARVDRPVPERIGLPACDAHRQHRGTGRDAGEPRRPAGADEQARHLRAVALDLRRIVGLRRCQRAGIPPITSIPCLDAAAQIRNRRIDAGVEQRDRHAAPVDAGHRDLGAVPGAAGRTPSARQHVETRRSTGTRREPDTRRRRRSRARDRDRARVDQRRETVEDAREAVVGVHRDALNASRERAASAPRASRSSRARSLRVPTMPPAAATRCASDRVRSTTISVARCATRGREPTRPRQPAALVSGSGSLSGALAARREEHCRRSRCDESAAAGRAAAQREAYASSPR